MYSMYTSHMEAHSKRSVDQGDEVCNKSLCASLTMSLKVAQRKMSSLFSLYLSHGGCHEQGTLFHLLHKRACSRMCHL